jgi:hypothetical protein
MNPNVHMGQLDASPIRSDRSPISSSGPDTLASAAFRQMIFEHGDLVLDYPTSGPDGFACIVSVEADPAARAPVRCNTGSRISDQGALQREGASARGGTGSGSYFDSVRPDTLKLAAKVDRESVELLGSEWIDKKDAASIEGEESPSVVGPKGVKLEVRAHGPNDNRSVLLEGEGIEVTAVPRGSTPVPWLSVSFGASWCWNEGIEGMTEWARDFCDLCGIEVTDTLVSRLDLCVDVDERFYRSDVGRFGGYFGGDVTGTVHFSDGAGGFTGFRYERSKSRPLTFRIYDKRKEAESGDGESFWPEVWDAHGVEEDVPKWRIEYEARRDRLKERGIDSWNSLTDSNLHRLWSYCTQQFSHMDREVWDRVQGASTQDAADREDVEPTYDPERAELQAMGCVRKIANKDGRDLADVLIDLKDKYA